MIEKIVKGFETKKAALNHMQIMSSPETVLVNQGDKWLVVCKKQVVVLEGECSETNIQTS